ncbi:MAG: IPExxxVDY family protein [Cyclobacteriaceae bacterium]|nr:IPExxxVDY family protein [Cyclobacteriaceae bacterium]
MKEIKLKTNVSYDFDLFGITSSHKDYKLAWHINKSLNVSLNKVEDFVVDFKEVKKLVVSCFEYKEQGVIMKLLSNKAYKEDGQQQDFLIPEHKHFDFFLLREGQDIEVTNLTNKLKQIKGLEFITKMDIMKLRSRENLIF